MTTLLALAAGLIALQGGAPANGGPPANDGPVSTARAVALPAPAAAKRPAKAAPPAPKGPFIHRYGDVAISPKGEVVASVESDETFGGSEKPHGAVVIRSAKDGAVVRVYDPCERCTYAGLTFSAQGDLAFIASDAAAGGAYLDVVREGRLLTLSGVKGVANTPRWSPNGAVIAVLHTANARKETGATQAGGPQVGEIGSKDDEQRIAVTQVTGGAQTHFVSPADTFIYEFDWTPDGEGFVATAAKGNGDNNWWVAKLIAVSARTGTVREIAAPTTQLDFPRVSPDGKTVAFIGGLMSDFGSVGGDLYTVPFSGGAPKNLTPGFKGSLTSIVWRDRAVMGTALIGAEAAVVSIDPGKGTVKPLWSAPASLSASDGKVAFSADGRLVAAEAQTFEIGPHIVTGLVAAPARLTHDNDALAPQVTARSVSWTSDGADVQGWLLSPRDLAPGRTYPMIVQIHGGPSNAATPEFVGRGPVKALTDAGYFVFLPNPRGSYGQGEAFTRANVRDFGGGDLKDILAGVDAVEKIAPVDDARLGVYGHSYGGFMTMWTVTHSHRFKAAVAGAGVANWVSYYGQNGIDQWMIPFFGSSAYDDPAIYDQLSPIRSIKNATTPTFIYGGERDVECPAAQSIEFWHGMKAVGAPVSLVIYEGEGHGIRKPVHVKDLETRIAGWFATYLK